MLSYLILVQTVQQTTLASKNQSDCSGAASYSLKNLELNQFDRIIAIDLKTNSWYSWHRLDETIPLSANIIFFCFLRKFRQGGGGRSCQG